MFSGKGVHATAMRLKCGTLSFISVIKCPERTFYIGMLSVLGNEAV